MDNINHPEHYVWTEVEPIDVIEAWELPYHLGNVIKYIARYRYKHDEIGDLRKAKWYMDRYVERRMKALRIGEYARRTGVLDE